MPWLATSLGITGVDTKVKEFKELRTGWEPQLTTANNFPAPEAKVHKDRAKWVNGNLTFGKTLVPNNATQCVNPVSSATFNPSLIFCDEKESYLQQHSDTGLGTTMNTSYR